ncbi:hypothetical protein V493_03337 [Pseudogymnoascus sp. VKM F-4281 (FW-2241)]|nr:hypothetical protein V493_03337 [Pseudogymnoascus sp. VKM F-4281 (FW-2241)]
MPRTLPMWGSSLHRFTVTPTPTPPSPGDNGVKQPGIVAAGVLLGDCFALAAGDIVQSHLAHIRSMPAMLAMAGGFRSTYNSPPSFEKRSYIFEGESEGVD